MRYTKILQGYGVKFNEPFRHGGKWKVITDGAFDASLKSGAIVRMLLEHDDSLEFGDSKSNLILHADDYGLAFRCFLRTDEISKHVRALAESKAYCDCSIGFKYAASDTTTRTISKTEVVLITKGDLDEISFLKAGACEQTSARLEDADKVGPLFEDSKSNALVRDNKFVHLMRTLQQLS